MSERGGVERLALSPPGSRDTLPKCLGGLRAGRSTGPFTARTHDVMRTYVLRRIVTLFT